MELHSQAYDKLIKRTEEIFIGLGLNNEALHSIDFSAISNYQEIVKAYILLCHAEFQQYIEIVCLKILSNATIKFSENGEIIKPILALLSTGIAKCVMPNSFGDSSKGDAGLQERLNSFVESYKSQLSNNNGITGSSLFKLFGFLGFTKEDVGKILIDLLNSHSIKRCCIAHCNPKINEQFYTLSEEKESIDSILEEISTLDLLILKRGYISSKDRFDNETSLLAILRDKRNGSI